MILNMWIYRGENLRTPFFFFILPSLASLLNGCSWKYGRWRKEKIPLYAFYEDLFVVVVKFLVIWRLRGKLVFPWKKRKRVKKIPVSEQKLSTRLIVVFHFYCCCFFRGGYGEVVASILTGVHTYVRMVHAHMCKCKLSILSTHWNITTTAV